MRTLVLSCAVLLFAGSTTPSILAANPIIFQGQDPTANPSNPRPVSDAAAAAFDVAAAALGPETRVDFESFTPGNFTNLTIAPGVVVTQAGNDPALGGIVNNGYTNSAGGYNTTTGGSRFLAFVPTFDVRTATLTFSFAQPVQAFGAYITDLEEAVAGDLSVRFNDGTSRSYALTGRPAPPGPGAQFFGFTDAGAAVSQVVLRLDNIIQTRDIIGVDDVRFVAVPEPAALGLALVCAPALLRRRRGIR